MGSEPVTTMPVFLSRPYGSSEDTPWGQGSAHPSVVSSSGKPQHPVLGNSAHDDKIDELVQQSHLQQSFYSHAKNMREDKLEESMHQNVEGARALCQHDERRQFEMDDFQRRHAHDSAQAGHHKDSYNESAKAYRARIMETGAYHENLCLNTPEGMLQFKKRMPKEDDFGSAEDYVERMCHESGVVASMASGAAKYQVNLPRTNGAKPNNFDDYSVMGRIERRIENRGSQPACSPLAQARAATKELQKAHKNEWKHSIGSAGFRSDESVGGITGVDTPMADTPYRTPAASAVSHRIPAESPAQRKMKEAIMEMDNSKVETGSISADTMDDYAVRLKKQFDKCDVDCSKLLEGDELVQMARWVWDTFHPDGEAIDAETQQKQTHKLLTDADDNGDGFLSFDELHSWYKKTCVAEQRKRMHNATASHAAPSPNKTSPSKAHSEIQAKSSKHTTAAASGSAAVLDRGHQSAAVDPLKPDKCETRPISVEVVEDVISEARAKFNSFDRDNNGTLEGHEVEDLAEWVWKNFHPGGEAVPHEIREAEASKLLTRHDANGDNGMDFAEFESWFKKTCVTIERFRLRGAKTSPSGKKQKQKSPAKSPAKPTPAAALPSPLKAGTTPSKYTPAALDPQQVINQMHQVAGYTVVIVCTSSQGMEDYWQARLEAGKGQVCGKDAKIVVVHEDWAGGAGNGLGSLYAYKKACEKANQNLAEVAHNGGSIVIYHTAGKGTRLAPLPGSEGNNKPGVKLPSEIKLASKEQGWLTSKDQGWFGETSLLTILEAVIIQTSLYAEATKCSFQLKSSDTHQTTMLTLWPSSESSLQKRDGTKEDLTSTVWSQSHLIHMLCSWRKYHTKPPRTTCLRRASNQERSEPHSAHSPSQFSCSMRSRTNSQQS